MADRVSVSIRIGGYLSPTLIDAFLAAIAFDGACADWDGRAVEPADLVDGTPLQLVTNDVAWGVFDAVEAFCREQRLPFARWSGGFAGAFGPQRVVFTGEASDSYAVTEADEVVVSAIEVRALGSHDAVLAHLAAAEFAVPPLRLNASVT